MRNLNELFKGITDEVEFANQRNKEIQCKMLQEARAMLIKANEGYKEESTAKVLFFTGKANGIAQSLRQYFNYKFEELMVVNREDWLPTDFTVDMNRLEKAITELSEGKVSFTK